MSEKKLVFWLLSLFTLHLNAQTYPSALVTLFNGDKSIFLDEFADPFHPRIRTTIFFTDFNQSSWSFRLRLTIKGPSGLQLRTNFNLRPERPIVVFPGQSMTLEGADLGWYFDPAHLDFTGLDKEQFTKNKRLPEGPYTFCFEALDYESGKELSLPACASAWLSLSDPVIITAPVNGAVIENTGLPSLIFQWQLSNVTAGINTMELSHVLRIYELNTNWTNPTSAILNNQALPIWESAPQAQNFILYGLAEPPLLRGRRYVFTVSSQSSDGRERFKNKGTSAPVYFHYGYYEGDTIEVIKPVDQFQFTLSTASQFKWKKPIHALPNQLISYTLRLVEINSNQSPENAMSNNTAFYQQDYLPVNSAIVDKTIPVMFWMNIKRMGRYAWQVIARSGLQEVARSPVQTFMGPPAIEHFIAGGFLMTVTHLTAFDSLTKIASGKCKTVLNPAWSAPREFNFQAITLSALGSNEWVMTAGTIRDAIPRGSFILLPDSIAENGKAAFIADSVLIDASSLQLSGEVNWRFPHAVLSGKAAELKSRRSRMTLSNFSFYLSSSSAVALRQAYRYNLLEPSGFSLRIDQRSSITLYQSRYRLSFSGFAEIAPAVKSGVKTPINIAFENAGQLYYLAEHNNLNSEALTLTKNLAMEIRPRSYILDLSEEYSPAEFPSDPLWKGLLIENAELYFPKALEQSSQLKLPLSRTYTLLNVPGDSVYIHLTASGFFFRTTFLFPDSDTLKLNTFPCRKAAFYAWIEKSNIKTAAIKMGIVVPLLDTLQVFACQINLKENGFEEAYLSEGLAGKSFTFNAVGANEQQILFFIHRALFKGRNRLELDVDLKWPSFGLQIPNIQGLSVWGNGNIGLDVPNGTSALTYQCKGQASQFDITVDYLGCGRNGNAYAFGVSAKINLDEEISGENGPPVINAYSICRNPLLTGSVTSRSLALNSSSASANGSSSTSSYQSGTSSYSTALVGGVSEMLLSRGLSVSDSLNVLAPENQSDPILKSETVMQLRELLAIIVRMRPFIKTKSISSRDWLVLDKLQVVLNSDVVNQAQLGNGRDLLNFVFNKAVESLVALLNGKIQSLSDKAVDKVHTAVFDKITDPVNKKIEESLRFVFDALQVKILAQIDTSYHTLVKASLKTVRKDLAAGINLSVNESFETNVFSKMTGLIQQGVTGEVKNYIRQEITSAATKLVKDGAGAPIHLGDFVDHAENVLADIADTLRDAILSVNGRNLLNTAESLVEDAVFEIDWTSIATKILKDLGMKGLSQALSNQVSQLFGQNAAPYITALLKNVKFDFTNLGDKLKKGEFDKIVKFDKTNIYLVTPAVDIRGALNFKKDDPEFGDSWQADVLVKVKVPKKDNPVECTAFFLNGKTKPSSGNFTYWFARLAVTGFSVPLSPAPIIWDGVEGFAFSKMKKTGAQSVVPDATNKFGIGAKFYFYDQQSAGRSYVFDLGADANFNEGGFAIQLLGNASFLNTNKQNGKYKAPGFVIGTGSLGYYKTPEFSKIAGKFTVQFQTSPLLCAGGEVGLDLQTPANWRVWLGKAEKPLAVKVLCKDFLSSTAFMEVSQAGFKAQLAMNIALKIQSPWIETTQMRFRGFSNLQLGYTANTLVEWEPDFRIQEAGFAAWLLANIGMEYQTAGSSTTLVLAGVALSGQLVYKSQPDAELHGELAGNISLAGYHVAFKAPVNYSLSKQAIIN